MQGTRLGAYDIVARLGAGGMGEVYRAHDPRLKRDVAIKVLPADLADDRDRLARLQREAMLLATVSHTNVATVYGFEETAGQSFLVMELVEGRGLDEIIGAGPLPVDDALDLAAQIAAGLEAAHDKDVIHRDLKPANVRITPGGEAKVLDFGLAKADPASASNRSSSQLTASPTVAAPTMAGVILGTAAYMSPEQARGRPLDRRTDVWSFGCVLFEMLTGRRPFDGDSVTDVMVALIKEEPDWSHLPTDLPPRIRTLLRRCLAKDPRQRLRDIGDARLELEEARAGFVEASDSVGPAATGRASGLPWRIAVPAALVLAAVAWMAARQLSPAAPAAGPASAVRLEVFPQPGTELLTMTSWPTLSPDGKTIAYAVRDGETTHIETRSLDEFMPRIVEGTAGGRGPTFSPDGQWLSFSHRTGGFMKVRAGGGRPLQLASTAPLDAVWTDDGRIIIDPSGGGLVAVAESGGEVVQITTPAEDAATHLHPHALPDGTILFTVLRSGGRSTLGRYFPDDGSWRDLGFQSDSTINYLPSGHLLFNRQGATYVTTFNLATGAIGSDAIPVLEDGDAYHLRVSPSGAAVYLHAPPIERHSIVRVNTDGSAQPLFESLPTLRWMRVAPDGRHLATGFMNRSGHGAVWVLDIASGRRTLLQDEGVDRTEPVFTWDSQRVAYSSARGPRSALYWQPTDGSGTSELIYSQPGFDTWPTSFSPDGNTLLFYGGLGNENIWAVSLEGERVGREIVTDPGNQRNAKFSPDGKWIAYSSSESGREEIYVRPYPELDRKYLVSIDGGLEPVWKPDGSALFFRWGESMMMAPIRTAPEFEAGLPRELFHGNYQIDPWGDQSYDVFPDGNSFAMIRVDNSSLRIRVDTGFMDELNRLLPIDSSR